MSAGLSRNLSFGPESAKERICHLVARVFRHEPPYSAWLGVSPNAGSEAILDRPLGRFRSAGGIADTDCVSRRRRHAAPQKRFSNWMDNASIVLALVSLVMLQAQPHFAWWIVLLIAGGRLAFSLVYRWNARKEEARSVARRESWPQPSDPGHP